jgi:hypothetical protein
MPPRSLGQRFTLKVLDREAAEPKASGSGGRVMGLLAEEIDPLTGPHTG